MQGVIVCVCVCDALSGLVNGRKDPGCFTLCCFCCSGSEALQKLQDVSSAQTDVDVVSLKRIYLEQCWGWNVAQGSTELSCGWEWRQGGWGCRSWGPSTCWLWVHAFQLLQTSTGRRTRKHPSTLAPSQQVTELTAHLRNFFTSRWAESWNRGSLTWLSLCRFLLGGRHLCLSDWRSVEHRWERSQHLGRVCSPKGKNPLQRHRRRVLWRLLQIQGIIFLL